MAFQGWVGVACFGAWEKPEYVGIFSDSIPGKSSQRKIRSALSPSFLSFGQNPDGLGCLYQIHSFYPLLFT
jgi:hypothetical protein